MSYSTEYYPNTRYLDQERLNHIISMSKELIKMIKHDLNGGNLTEASLVNSVRQDPLFLTNQMMIDLKVNGIQNYMERNLQISLNDSSSVTNNEKGILKLYIDIVAFRR